MSFRTTQQRKYRPAIVTTSSEATVAMLIQRLIKNLETERIARTMQVNFASDVIEVKTKGSNSSYLETPAVINCQYVQVKQKAISGK